MDHQTIGVIITIGLAWTGLLTGIIKWILDRYSAVMQAKIDELAKENRELRDSITELVARLPIEYVRQDHCKACREEWLRIVNIIDQKLMTFSERLGEKIDMLRRELYERHG